MFSDSIEERLLPARPLSDAVPSLGRELAHSMCFAGFSVAGLGRTTHRRWRNSARRCDKRTAGSASRGRIFPSGQNGCEIGEATARAEHESEGLIMGLLMRNYERRCAERCSGSCAELLAEMPTSTMSGSRHSKVHDRCGGVRLP